MLSTHFPTEFEPRKNQLSAINQIEEGWRKHKIIICNAPTGIGKSFLSKTIANASDQCNHKFKALVNSYDAYKMDKDGYVYADEIAAAPSHGCYALTITKSLQDQYNTLFSDCSVLKGKSNYQCKVATEFSVEDAPCTYTSGMKQDCWSQDYCTYYKDRNAALTSQFASLNYRMYMSLPDYLKKRQYLICDEASELEGELVGNSTLTITKKTLQYVGIPTILPPEDQYKTHIWLNSILDNLSDKERLLKKKLSNKMTKNMQTFLNKLTATRNLKTRIENIKSKWKKCEYIVMRDDESITMTPLRVYPLANEIFKHGEKILLMSATIIDHENFAKTLGIDEYTYIELDSPFDPKRAPIKIAPGISINYKNMDKVLPYIAEKVDNICREHKKFKGIIHTHTNKINNFLEEYFHKDPRFLFKTDSVSNEDIIKEHFSSKSPTILVSPSLTHGIDLKGKYCMFQIILKAPFAPLGDRRVRKLFEENKDWYQAQMLSTLIQACGRGIRGETDACITYILDGGIAKSVIQNRTKIPKYFIDRFI